MRLVAELSKLTWKAISVNRITRGPGLKEISHGCGCFTRDNAKATAGLVDLFGSETRRFSNPLAERFLTIVKKLP